jgi:uncharacterized protein YjiS (DUF1127 family)
MTIQIERLKAAFNRAMEAACVKINSSAFAAAQRRRALAGLDTRQLADIGLIYVDGDYRPHPDLVAWRADIGVSSLRNTLNPLVPAKAGTQGQNNDLIRHSGFPLARE